MKTKQQPTFNHPVDTRDGRIERAVWTLREADGKFPMANVMVYLTKKGCSDEEIMIALDQASGGVLVDVALSGVALGRR